MGALCCCCPKETSYHMNNDSNVYDEDSPIGPENEAEKRARLANAAEQRLKQQQTRGVIGNSGGAPLRTAHAELPGNVDSNLRWQTS